MSRFHFTKSIARALVLAGGALAIVTAFAANPMGHLRGTIVSAAPDRLVVRTSEGDVSVAIDATTRVAGVVASHLDQVKSGTFVGIANVPGADASQALEVVVFPEAMKGTGLGDYPWDLAPAGGSTSAMTNGTVTTASAGAGAASTMTNGTVRSTSTANGLLLTVDYGKGEKKIQVPASVPVVGIVPADASKLVPGAHVFVATRKDAPQAAGFIAVGIDGAVPPM
jgi:hypothetical protein